MAARTGSGDAHPELADDPDPGPLAASMLVLVGIGGAIGTAARYGLSNWLPAGTGLPRGTLIANLAGALVLGVLLEALALRGRDEGGRRRLRLLIGTGFCGGLTTYSTLAVESNLLVRGHRDALAAGYAVGSIVAGIVLAAFGVWLAARIRRRSP
jgi:fluoride exporter